MVEFTQAEKDYFEFRARLISKNPAVADYLSNMVHYLITTTPDDYDKGDFNGAFEALRSAGIVTLHDKTITRRLIREKRGE